MNVGQEWQLKRSIMWCCMEQICQPTGKCSSFPQVKSKDGTLQYIHYHILPYLKIWPFKPQVSAAALALFNPNAQYSTAFCLLDEKDVKLMGQHY